MVRKIDNSKYDLALVTDYSRDDRQLTIHLCTSSRKNVDVLTCTGCSHMQFTDGWKDPQISIKVAPVGFTLMDANNDLIISCDAFHLDENVDPIPNNQN